MAETGSTRVRRRINTLFASISTQGRTACSALTTDGTPLPPYPLALAKHGTQYGCEGPGGKVTVQS